MHQPQLVQFHHHRNSVMSELLYERRFLQVKRPNQQYQSTEGKSTKEKSNNAKNKIHIGCL